VKTYSFTAAETIDGLNKRDRAAFEKFLTEHGIIVRAGEKDPWREYHALTRDALLALVEQYQAVKPSDIRETSTAFNCITVQYPTTIDARDKKAWDTFNTFLAEHGIVARRVSARDEAQEFDYDALTEDALVALHGSTWGEFLLLPEEEEED
jgi:hypothetical protein